MTAEIGGEAARRRVVGRVVFWVLVVASALTPFWVSFTPLRSIPLLGLLIVFFGWAIYAGVRRSKRGLVGLGAGFALLVVFGLITGMAMAPLQTPTLTSSPVELSKIVDLSRYRSCAGHDFSGPSAEDPGTTETDRSMKHYVTLSDTYGGGVEVPVLAVTSGTITKAATVVHNEGSVLADVGDFNGEVTLLADTNSLFGTWNIRYMHVHPTRAVGSRVSAGDVIATVPPKDWAGVTNNETGAKALNSNQPISFDVAVEYDPLFPVGARNESYVKLLSSQLRSQYADDGYSLAALTISRAERDAAPCNGRYNENATADWVNGDKVRQAADAATAATSTPGKGQSAPNGSGGASGAGSTGGSPVTTVASRPECTTGNLGQTFTDSNGNWKCMRSAEGNLTWGPG